MKDAILIQHIYPNTPGVKMLELTRERHAAYCEHWNMEYRPVIDKVFEHDENLGNWARIKLIQNALAEGYYYVIWLDADTLIYDMTVDLRLAVEPRRIGVCWHRIPQLHHWNIGAMYMDNTEEVRAFVDEWLKTYPPSTGWLEQGIFNDLARKGKTVVTVSDKWNATLDVNMVPDAVVLGFHGQGDTEYRTEMMKTALDRIAKRESALASPADGERRT